MKPHEQRVVLERADLDGKIAKLSAFFDTPAFKQLFPEDRMLLITQHWIMREYSQILDRRIERFVQ